MPSAIRSFIFLLVILGTAFSFSGCSSLTKESETGRLAPQAVGKEKLGKLDLNLTVEKKVLDNGLTVLVSSNPRLPIFSYYTFFDVGGRYERKGTTGATHFLEHMMFKGSKNFGPGVFDTAIEKSGGSTNAYTSFDRTVYYEKLPTDMLDRIIELEADRMRGVRLTPESFESEREVIFNERKMRYENSPEGIRYLKMMQNFFRGTPYGGSVIGTPEDLKNLDTESLRKFFHNFYTPDNAIIVVVGDVNPEDVFEEIEDQYGDLEASDEELKAYKKKMDREKLYEIDPDYGKHVRLKSNTQEPLFSMAFPGEPIGTKRGFELDFVSSIMGGGESSYLYQHYVKGRRQRLSSISASNYQLQYNGIFFLSGSLMKGTDLNWLKQDLLRKTRNACRREVTERNVQKVKNQILAGFYRQLTTNKGVAHFLGLREHAYGDYRAYKKELEAYGTMTAERVKKACFDVFDPKEYIFISVDKK